MSEEKTEVTAEPEAKPKTKAKAESKPQPMDFDKPYAKVFGVRGVAFLQDGKHYNFGGEEVKKAES